VDADQKSTNGIANLRGRELSSVEFVRDYIQLRFDGPVLTAYTLPTITAGEKVIVSGAPGYRDSLCARIGTSVRDVSIQEGEAITLRFEDGVEVQISLRPESYTGAEAAMLSNSAEDTWVW
jgi:hypothetical protein